MILIVDNTVRKFRVSVREKLHSLCIPCAVSHLDYIDILFPATFCAVTERYLYEDTVFMSRMHSRTPVKVIEESPTFVEEVLEHYNVFHEAMVEKAKERYITFSERGLLYYGKYISLTKTEKRIINLLVDSKDYVIWEKVSGYCLKDPKVSQGTVAVHISNINKKTIAATGREIIECRRYEGYKLN